MVPVPPPPTVISTATEQSGVERRNLRPPWYQCLPLPLSFRPQRSVVEKSPDSVGQAPMRWEISRLRVSMIYKYFIPISTRSPARDDMLAGSSQSWGTETNDTDTTPSHLSFRPERSKAEWSGEISGPHAAAPLRWEISGLRATINFKYLYPHTDTQPRSR